MELEFCEDCVNNECATHDWFTSQKLKNEKDVLVAELRHMLDTSIIPKIVQKVHLVMHQYLDLLKFDDFCFIGGNLVFAVDTISATKKDGVYVPVTGYMSNDNVIDYDIEIKAVKMVRGI